jgi:hypothetical protein
VHYYACPYRSLFTDSSNETSQERPLPAAATCDETPRLATAGERNSARVIIQGVIWPISTPVTDRIGFHRSDVWPDNREHRPVRIEQA